MYYKALETFSSNKIYEETLKEFRRPLYLDKGLIKEWIGIFSNASVDDKDFRIRIETNKRLAALYVLHQLYHLHLQENKFRHASIKKPFIFYENMHSRFPKFDRIDILVILGGYIEKIDNRTYSHLDKMITKYTSEEIKNLFLASMEYLDELYPHGTLPECFFSISCKTCQKNFDLVEYGSGGDIEWGKFWEHQCRHIADLKYDKCLYQVRTVNNKRVDIVPINEKTKFDNGGLLCYAEKIIECKVNLDFIVGTTLRKSILRYIDQCDILEFWVPGKFTSKLYSKIETRNIRYCKQPGLERVEPESANQLPYIEKARKLIGNKKIDIKGALPLINFLKQIGNKDILEDIKELILQRHLYLKYRMGILSSDCSFLEKLTTQKILTEFGFESYRKLKFQERGNSSKCLTHPKKPYLNI